MEEGQEILHFFRHVKPLFRLDVPEKGASPTRLLHASPLLNMVSITNGPARMTDLNDEMVSLIISPLASNGFCDPIGVVRPQYQYILPPVLIVVRAIGCDRAIRGFPVPIVLVLVCGAKRSSRSTGGSSGTQS